MPRYRLPKLEPGAAAGVTPVGDGPALGVWWNAGVVRDSGDPPRLAPGTPLLILWSGGLGAGLFEADPRTWMGSGWGALERALPVLSQRAGEAGARVAIRPHARHVVSDGPGTARLLREHPEVRVLLDPAAMLTRAMLPTAPEHLERILALLAGHPGVAGLVLGNVREPAAGAGEDPPLERVGLREGVIDPGLIVDLAERYAPADLPRVEELAG